MNETVVKEQYPRATASSDYNHEACWTYIYEDHDEDGLGIGNIIGCGQFEEEAWKDAARRLYKLPRI